MYALAAMRAGADAVEVVHVFLEAPEHPVGASFLTWPAGARGRAVRVWPGGCSARRFPVAENPHRALCGGCPAEGGLCSWPLAMTRREAVDRLFYP